MKRHVINFSLVVFSIAISFTAVELLCRKLNQTARRIGAIKEYEGGGFLMPDPLLGARLNPNHRLSVTGMLNRKPVYQAKYTIDSTGNRETPLDDTSIRDNHAVFLGCSYTFGESVNDNQTLPYYFAKAFPDHRPYNFGAPGYGPQHALMQLQDKSFIDRIKEKNGIAIYTFIDHHVDRASGTMNAFMMWTKNYPHFTAVDGTLVYRGSFESARPNLSRAYRVLSQSGIFQFLDFPPRFLQSYMEYPTLTFQIIEGAAQKYFDLFPSGKFYVLVFPGETRHAEALRKYFKNSPIQVVDYSGRFNPEREGRMIEGDNHPRADVYEQVATYLKENVLTQ